MEIDEVAARLVRQYWALLVICTLLPVVVVALIVVRQPAMYAADARIITSSQVPVTSSAADAIVSQVQAIATGPTSAGAALRNAGVRTNVANFVVNHVTVNGLGTSQVVDVTVTDPSPQVAQKAARVLADEVVNALNKVSQGGLSTTLAALDSEIVTLTEQRAALSAQTAQNPQNQQLQAKLAGLDEVISNFTSDRGRLLIQASTQGLAEVIDQPGLPQAPESKGLAQKLGLAGLLGLVLGILLAAGAETIRPTVPGARRVSRRLSSPMLGSLTETEMHGTRTVTFDNVALRVRLAAANAGVSTVALVDAEGQQALADLADKLTQANLPGVPGTVCGGFKRNRQRRQACHHSDLYRLRYADSCGRPGTTCGHRPGCGACLLDRADPVSNRDRQGWHRRAVRPGCQGVSDLSSQRPERRVGLADYRSDRCSPATQLAETVARPRGLGGAGCQWRDRGWCDRSRRTDDGQRMTGSVTGARPLVPFANAEIVPEAQQAALEALRSGWITMGPQTAEFERELAAYLGARHVVAVSTCTGAIEIAIRALRLPSGAAVLTPSLTFCGAVAPILHAGLRPVLVDVAADTLLPTSASVAAAASRAAPPEAMIIQHMGGRPADVAQLAAAAGLPLSRIIEDAAHGLGGELHGTPVGGCSHAACFSFYATKNLPIGEGGAIATDDGELAGYARRIRLHGMSRDAWRRYQPGGSWRYDVAEPGLKANITDVQAAIGRAQLAWLPRWQQRREQLAARYDHALARLPGLVLPSRPADARHAWHLYQIRVTEEFGPSRDDVIDALAAQGIGTSVHFIPVHRFSGYRHLLGPQECRSVPVTDQVANEILSLPMYPALTEAQLEHVTTALLNMAGRPTPHLALRTRKGEERAELAADTA